jgi:hypothetical protein
VTISPELIVGSILTIMLAVIGYLYTRINGIEAKADSRIDAVIKLIDGVKDDYVKRIDNDGKMGRIEKTVDEVRVDMKDVSQMLVKVLVALGKQV